VREAFAGRAADSARDVIIIVSSPGVLSVSTMASSWPLGLAQSAAPTARASVRPQEPRFAFRAASGAGRCVPEALADTVESSDRPHSVLPLHLIGDDRQGP
jgi:hypothetical protein